MSKHTIKGPRTMSSKESDHIRHNQHAIRKSGVDTAAEASAEVVANSEAVSGLVYVLSKVNFNLQRTLHKNNKLINNCPSHIINTPPQGHMTSHPHASHMIMF